MIYMTSEYQPNIQKLEIRSLPSSGSWPSALFGHFCRLNLCYWPLPASLALRQMNHLFNLTWQVLCSVMHDAFPGTSGFHLKPNSQVLVPRLKCWGSCLYSLPHLPRVAGWVPDPALPFFSVSMAGKVFLASPHNVVCAGYGAAAGMLMSPVKVSGSPALTPSGLGSPVQLFPCWTSWRCKTERTPVMPWDREREKASVSHSGLWGFLGSCKDVLTY